MAMTVFDGKVIVSTAKKTINWGGDPNPKFSRGKGVVKGLNVGMDRIPEKADISLRELYNYIQYEWKNEKMKFPFPILLPEK